MRAVIVGLGYVGLPLANAASGSGIDVVGLDLNERIVDGLNAGHSHIDDLTDNEIGRLLESGFRATTDTSVLDNTDVVVICVPTPLDDMGQPDLHAVMSASRTIAERISAGTTVVLESTTYPGTTQEILQPMFEAGGRVCGADFFLAFSPERIDPGNDTYKITNTPKVVGGVTPACTEHAAAFYRTFVSEVVPAKSPREAETAKLLENTYRHVNIALVNELAQFCYSMNIDIWDVIRLAKTKPFGFQSFTPSAGVGGHCIPIDPNYLAFKVRAELDRPFRFVELAQEINQSMPTYVSRRLQDLLNDHFKPVRGSRVLLIGVTYKPDISDRRESPAVPLATRLLSMGCELSYHDPFVPEWSVGGTPVPQATDLQTACAMADAIIIVQAHRQYLLDASSIVDSGTPILDATGKFYGETLVRI